MAWIFLYSYVTVRPDLAKLGYFLKSLAILSDGFLVLAQIWSPFCQLNSIEQNFWKAIKPSGHTESYDRVLMKKIKSFYFADITLFFDGIRTLEWIVLPLDDRIHSQWQGEGRRGGAEISRLIPFLKFTGPWTG